METTKRKSTSSHERRNHKERKVEHRNEKIVKKIRKKVSERLRREYGNQRDFLAGESLIFAKIVYDISRSGTQDQMNEIEIVSPIILNLLDSQLIQTISTTTRIQQCYYFSESAFLLALSGVKSDQIYHTIARNVAVLLSDLSFGTTNEVELFINTLEHLALSGLRTTSDNGSGFQLLHPVAQSISLSFSRSDPLAVSLHNFLVDMTYEKGHNHTNFGYWLHSPAGGPLMALWLHSTKQKKVRCVFEDTQLPPGTRKAKLSTVRAVSQGTQRSRVIWDGDSPLGFADMSLPLVVDVGCGFGVSLLGVAAMAEEVARSHISDSSIGNWNCLGCDLSSHCIHYAQSISSRWNLSHRCRFCIAPAEDFVEWVKSYYPGPVVWLLVQFPTPYALQIKSHEINRNIQLPVLVGEEVLDTSKLVESTESGFMVTNHLIETLLSLLAKKQVDYTPRLYFQSNVEDVAVTIRRKVELKIDNLQLKARCISEFEEYCRLCENVSRSNLSDSEVRTQRQDIWEQLGGERIEIGSNGWLRRSPLPIYCRTETEAAYARMNKPVYRIGWEIQEI